MVVPQEQGMFLFVFIMVSSLNEEENTLWNRREESIQLFVWLNVWLCNLWMKCVVVRG